MKKRFAIVLTTFLILLSIRGYAMGLQLTSPAFSHEGAIPLQYTCQGQDLSPALNWNGAPPKTAALALIVDDPDAPVGTWIHWVLFNIPATTTSLAAGISPQEKLPDGSLQGLNDFQKVGYGGPCPPPGGPHRYFFKLYALDASLNLPPKATKAQLLDAMKGHVLTETQLMGTYRAAH
ncbi:MAG: hypothetical protein A3F89_00105 [Deltaproteobacteria bacterium RIFCSPLOWO2_12_FULL_50_11]|nr:MAG: hypothetical protein A3F89_00105 [Deltaproteobacteria bacterium RIFCSPLOWO2_12_FULL_50_11]